MTIGSGPGGRRRRGAAPARAARRDRGRVRRHELQRLGRQRRPHRAALAARDGPADGDPLDRQLGRRRRRRQHGPARPAQDRRRSARAAPTSPASRTPASRRRTSSPAPRVELIAPRDRRPRGLRDRSRAGDGRYALTATCAANALGLVAARAATPRGNREAALAGFAALGRAPARDAERDGAGGARRRRRRRSPRRSPRPRAAYDLAADVPRRRARRRRRRARRRGGAAARPAAAARPTTPRCCPRSAPRCRSSAPRSVRTLDRRRHGAARRARRRAAPASPPARRRDGLGRDELRPAHRRAARRRHRRRGAAGRRLAARSSAATTSSPRRPPRRSTSTPGRCGSWPSPTTTASSRDPRTAPSRSSTCAARSRSRSRRRSVIADDTERLIAKLREAITAGSLHLGIATMIPRVILICGPNILDLSDARRAEDVLTAARDGARRPTRAGRRGRAALTVALPQSRPALVRRDRGGARRRPRDRRHRRLPRRPGRPGVAVAGEGPRADAVDAPAGDRRHLADLGRVPDRRQGRQGGGAGAAAGREGPAGAGHDGVRRREARPDVLDPAGAAKIVRRSRPRSARRSRRSRPRPT